MLSVLSCNLSRVTGFRMVLIAYGKFINCGLACHDGAGIELLIPSELVLDLLKDVIFRVTTIYIYKINSNNNIIYNIKG